MTSERVREVSRSELTKDDGSIMVEEEVTVEVIMVEVEQGLIPMLLLLSSSPLSHALWQATYPAKCPARTSGLLIQAAQITWLSELNT
jgi:hypothetical protein